MDFIIQQQKHADYGKGSLSLHDLSDFSDNKDWNWYKYHTDRYISSFRFINLTSSIPVI